MLPKEVIIGTLENVTTIRTITIDHLTFLILGCTNSEKKHYKITMLNTVSYGPQHEPYLTAL